MSAQPGRATPVGRWLAIAASVVVAVTVVSALVVMGSPAQQRMRALDVRRIQELTALSQAIDLHAAHNAKLPASARDLEGAGQWLSLEDPATGSPYVYATTGPRTYRLCAVFESSTQAADVRGGWVAGEWTHPAGRHCFDRKAKSE